MSGPREPLLGVVGLTWNLGSDLHELFSQHFMVNAFVAGTIVAATAGAIGWFMVLRRQSFAGHTLAVVSFPGAAGAVLIGASATAGYFTAAVAAALVIALVPRSAGGSAYSHESAVIGTVQAFALACGALFVSLYGGFLNGVTGLLFGTFLGISGTQVTVLGLVALGALAALAVMARPLFFATVDADVARARGVPVGALSVSFLILLACAAAEVSQITGTLLVFALLVMPGGRRPAAHRPPVRQLPAHGRDRAGGRLARTGGGVFLRLSRGLLRDDVRLRFLWGGCRRRGGIETVGTALPGAADGRGVSVLAAVGPLAGIAHMLSHPFLRYALLAGTAIGLACGLVGYFVVLRSQVFTGDALSHVAFTGALAALVAGVDLLLGLYVACVAVALIMAGLGSRGRADDTVIGNVFAWTLGLGALLLTVYTTSSSGADASSGVNVLFGTIFGLSPAHAITDAAISVGVAASVLGIGRPLLFASVDEAVASARGVPVRVLGFLFLALVGLTAAAAAQAVGALLLLGLLAAPAGAAQRLTARPFRAMALSAGISVGATWAGVAIAYAVPSVPASFGIVAVATACYLVAFLVSPAGARSRPQT